MLSIITLVGGLIVKLVELLLGEYTKNNSSVVEQANYDLREKMNQVLADSAGTKANVPEASKVEKLVVKEAEDGTITIDPTAGFRK